MENHRVEAFAALHDLLIAFRKNKSWLFRGQSNASWPLLPRAGREPYRDCSDDHVFEAWKRRAVEHVQITPKSDWEWLAIAQHHGLATRLMDWTTNPLNAAYFAVREPVQVDCAIFAARIERRVNESKSPMKHEGLGTYWPAGVVPRIVRQGGIFSIHGSPKEPMIGESDGVLELAKIVVPSNSRDGLLRELSYYGINASMLFPDLDGLSQFLNWTVESKEYWGTPESSVPATTKKTSEGSMG